MNGVSEEKSEARRLRELAEKRFRDSNLKSAVKYAKRAHRLDPNLDGAAEILTSFQILRVAADSSDDWYRILQVEPFAHINTIKKQYKKLALLLHPDKNPYSGSEEAFKLVGEAFHCLSDKVRRKEYDLKLRIRIQDEKIGDAAVESETFWTACSTCRLLHQFEKRYVEHNLVCPSCRKSFKAVEVVYNEPEIREIGVMVGGRRLRNLSSRQNFGSFEGLNVSLNTVQSKRNAAARKMYGEKKKGLESNGKAGSVEGEVGNGDLEEGVDDDDGICRRRLRSGSMRKKMSSVGEVLERSKLKPVKIEEEMTLAELQSQVIQKSRKEKMKLKLKEEEEAEEGENKRKKGVEENDDDDERLTLKEMKGRLRIRWQGTSNSAGCSENAKQRNSKKNVNLETQKRQGTSCNGVDLDMMMVEDSDFYDFDKDRMERSFKKGQVWAVYDDDDGMPRHYGLIEEVTVNPFEVKMSWLDVQNNGDERLLCWEMMGFHVSCGRFKVTKKTTTHALNIFSHVVDCERAAKEVYRIYPKKGSVWALYKEEEEGLDAEKRRNLSNKEKRTYDIAVFLTTYSEMHGLSMAYLEKVNGYKTIFKRREIGYHAIRWFEKDDIRLFSHQIPARKLSIDEALGQLKDCWELDPASLPSDLLTTC
ncbi:uncharacterized protein LOC103490746 [Cucumis melo]|uniref:Uncharacterized protein LOC103490746 n=1 Tax=Cucumis melo TaxID=3656 RepID=A0A1S3BJI7_CUCME|nr:uncharacterized protein LOC103490746 [Cucumis melo]